jgi:hypothetical protein
MHARQADSARETAADHVEHEQAIDSLYALTDEVEHARPQERHAVAQGLYRQLSLFIAENFEHMHVEETAHNAVLWARYTDAELIAIHDALVAAIPPEEMMFVLRWMVPFMNPAEFTHLYLLGTSALMTANCSATVVRTPCASGGPS